jgi:hypothetical protein
MACRRNLIASVAAKLLPLKLVRLRGSLGWTGSGTVVGGSELLSLASDEGDRRSVKDEVSLDGLEGRGNAMGTIERNGGG